MQKGSCILYNQHLYGCIPLKPSRRISLPISSSRRVCRKNYSIFEYHIDFHQNKRSGDMNFSTSVSFGIVGEEVYHPSLARNKMTFWTLFHWGRQKLIEVENVSIFRFWDSDLPTNFRKFNLFIRNHVCQWPSRQLDRKKESLDSWWGLLFCHWWRT